MNDIEYTDPRVFNYTYDGRVLTIMGLHDKNMTELVVPPEFDGVPVSVIGNAAFAFNRSLKRIILPDSVVTVENSAFKGCESLVDAVLSRSLNSIGAMAFSGCSNLRRLTISNHTDRIEINSFSGCTSLENIVVKIREWEPEAAPVGAADPHAGLNDSLILGHSGFGEKPDAEGKRTFAICSESEMAVWLYVRAIMRATDPASPHMDKYDSAFMEMRDESDKFRIALSRMQEPYDLADDMRIVYKNVLSNMVNNIIREDRVDRLTALGHLGCIDMKNIDSYMDLACRIGGGCVAYLLEHKRRNMSLGAGDFEL